MAATDRREGTLSPRYWLAVAKKVETSDEDGTEKLLLEKSLEELRTSPERENEVRPVPQRRTTTTRAGEDTKKLDDTRWMFEDMPADPDAIEASVGL